MNALAPGRFPVLYILYVYSRVGLLCSWKREMASLWGETNSPWLPLSPCHVLSHNTICILDYFVCASSLGCARPAGRPARLPFYLSIYLGYIPCSLPLSSRYHCWPPSQTDQWIAGENCLPAGKWWHWSSKRGKRIPLAYRTEQLLLLWMLLV